MRRNEWDTEDDENKFWEKLPQILKHTWNGSVVWIIGIVITVVIVPLVTITITQYTREQLSINAQQDKDREGDKVFLHSHIQELYKLHDKQEAHFHSTDADLKRVADIQRDRTGNVMRVEQLGEKVRQLEIDVIRLANRLEFLEQRLPMIRPQSLMQDDNAAQEYPH